MAETTLKDDRAYLSKQIDAAVEGHLTDELLGRLVKHTLGLRYYDSATDRLTGMIESAVQRKVEKLIALWLEEWDASLWDGVKARLEGTHLDALASQITDAFVAAVAKGEAP